MKICFLRSSNGIRAVKKFTAKGVRSYPQIKNFTSHESILPFSTKGFEQKLQILREQAAIGSCLVKGVLNRPLKQESRKGAVNADVTTQNIILDVDSIVLPNFKVPEVLTREVLEEIAETVVNELPKCFQTTSYVIHVSSSMGLKPNKISIHLDFWLNKPIHPKILKEYLIALNFQVPLFNSQFELSGSGNALHYPLDRCVADNSRLLYIGNPIFSDGILDPIPDINDRVFAVNKKDLAVDLSEEITNDITHTKNRKLITTKINELRQIQGLPERTKKVKTISISGRNIHVVTNPDQIKMEMVEDRGDWVTYNINGGDSAAYYVMKYNPNVVYNFKSEPNFLFEQADPEGYQLHVEDFILNGDMKGRPKGEAAILLPIIFRDYASNTYYNGLFNTSTGFMESINPTNKDGLNDFMAQYGAVMGENVPIWRYEFNPLTEVSIDFRTRFINKYVPSLLMREKVSLPRTYTPLKYNTGFMLEKYCPTIFKLIFHVIGGQMEEYLHFMNWLATSLQLKKKTMTAWVLQGVQGSGKGQLFEKIIAPLVGTGIDDNYPYAIKLRQENLEEQFNQWEETTLFAALDEFRLNNSTGSHKLLNKIKNMITDEMNTVRGMRENTRRVKLYTDYLIFANDEDMLSLPNDDRRFNIAPRQVSKLIGVFKNTDTALDKLIPAEMPKFARIMKEFIIDKKQAHTCLNNAAKRAVRAASSTSVEEFIQALKTGDFEYFLPILDLPYSTPGTDYATPAKLLMKKVLLDWDNDEKIVSKLTTDQIRILYCCLIGRVDNVNKFGKLLGRNGIKPKKIRLGKVTKSGLEIFWSLNENNIEALKETYCVDTNLQFANKVVPIETANKEQPHDSTKS